MLAACGKAVLTGSLPAGKTVSTGPHPARADADRLPRAASARWKALRAWRCGATWPTVRLSSMAKNGKRRIWTAQQRKAGIWPRLRLIAMLGEPRVGAVVPSASPRSDARAMLYTRGTSRLAGSAAPARPASRPRPAPFARDSNDAMALFALRNGASNVVSVPVSRAEPASSARLGAKS